MSANMSNPFFSIIIPTRNESTDILKTLTSIRNNTFANYEVLVVDASSDNTPQLVREFGASRFRLLPQDNKDGRCGARNQGIRQALGEVLVILNADVRLPVDFLEKLKKHYDTGADYVIVDSIVENRLHPFGAMIEAEHRYLYHSGRETVDWCEGYSCRRKCAIDVGLFPEKHKVPICAGEDAVFGQEIAKRFQRVVDMSILVSHAVPEDFKTFWDQRIGRGEGCTQRRMLLDHWSFPHALLDATIWSVKGLLWILLIFPWVRYANNLQRAFPEVPAPQMYRPILLARVAHEIGRWKTFFKLL